MFDAMPKSDDEYEVDLTSAENKGFPVIPDGRYVAQVVDFVKGTSQAGNPQFVWTFRITQGEYKGSEFKQWTALTPAAMWKVAETLESLGAKAYGKIIKFKRGDVLKKTLIIEVQEETYENRPQSKITRTYPISQAKKKADDGPPVEISEEKAKDIIKEKKKEEPKDKVTEPEQKGLFG